MTRMFENCKEAINEIERDLHEMGIQVHPHSMQNKIVKDDERFQTKEVRAYSFMILDSSDKDEIVGDCLEWNKAEAKERFSLQPLNPGRAWKLRNKVWEEFLDQHDKFDYTYSERMYYQIPAIIGELKRNPDTRQAIIQIHNRDVDQHRMQKQRIPCSMYYQLMIRESKLDIIYTMRSSDFYTHFKNDIWQACELRDTIAGLLKIPTGHFHMFIGSLHMYKGYGDKHVF